MSVFTNGQWLVGCKTADNFWTPVSAKSLLGAKRCATNTYQVSVGGQMQVARVVGEGEQQQIVEMSRKHGYDNWVDAP